MFKMVLEFPVAFPDTVSFSEAWPFSIMRRIIKPCYISICFMGDILIMNPPDQRYFSTNLIVSSCSFHQSSKFKFHSTKKGWETPFNIAHVHVETVFSIMDTYQYCKLYYFEKEKHWIFPRIKWSSHYLAISILPFWKEILDVSCLWMVEDLGVFCTFLKLQKFLFSALQTI